MLGIGQAEVLVAQQVSAPWAPPPQQLSLSVAVALWVLVVAMAVSWQQPIGLSFAWIR